MTETEALVVRYLAVVPRSTASQVARSLWPNSSAWERATNRSDGRAGAHGGTMPMRAGRVLSTMLDKGFVVPEYHSKSATRWSASVTGVIKAMRHKDKA